MTNIEIGRLLRSGIAGCVVGCKVSQQDVPEFGGMVRIPIGDLPQTQVFGLVYDIHSDDDGLVRQLVTSERVSEEIIMDNRLNRNVPLEISVLFVGYQVGQHIYHLLPPRPPLTLDAIYPCDQEDLVRFSPIGQFGYFRHVLRASDLPVSELIASHFKQMVQAQHVIGHPNWGMAAVQELITLLRDDYPTLMAVLGAVADARLDIEVSN
jgi:hypothetical protein